MYPTERRRLPREDQAPGWLVLPDGLCPWIREVTRGQSHRSFDACFQDQENALLATILAPVVDTLFASAADLTETENLLFRLRAPLAVALARAVILSVVVTGIAAWCSRRRIVLKI